MQTKQNVWSSMMKRQRWSPNYVIPFLIAQQTYTHTSTHTKFIGIVRNKSNNIRIFFIQKKQVTSFTGIIVTLNTDLNL